MELAGKSENDKTNRSCSTNVDNNRFSTKIYFELRKQNFLEAFDREHESLSNCQDTNSVGEIVAKDPKTIVEENPPPNKRLKFPATESHFGWQHIPDPVTPTPSMDHVYEPRSNPSNTVKDSSLFPTANAISGIPVKVFKDPNQLDEVPSPENYLPKKVALTLNNDSPPTSMDFHPTRNFILLGCFIPDITI
ncbi:hypothetical protein QN277_015231 [Acacia crassicarpa]|uniref:TPR1-like CTLH-containing domain-containing protein n=1 Tax=Acacia crassicarpa TaxID=499986 RepID=A0AAE1KLR3_9FABA|nr:hypothetical protein QN277_015231 [Acacia crassicarpa]